MDPFGGPDTLDITTYHALGATMYNATVYGPDYQPYVGIPLIETQNYAPTPDPRAMMASWSTHYVVPWLEPGGQWPKSNSVDWRCVDARGWPLVCFYSEYLLTPNFGHGTRGSFTMPGTRVRHYGDLFGRNKSVELPYIPIWPNFAIDSAIYSAAWWLLLIAPLTIRSTLRRRRGRCPACGYNLSATPAPLPCPECGHTRNLPTSNR